MIVTAGGIDCHVHFICPQLAFEAISSGELYNENTSAGNCMCNTHNTLYSCVDEIG